MHKYRHKQSSIFLLEIMLNIILFSVLLIISLQFFVKTETLTVKTTQLHNGVTLCSNVATIYEEGGTELIRKEFPNSLQTSQQIIIFYDKNFNLCEKGQNYFKLQISTIEFNEGLEKSTISCLNDQNQTIYSIDVCHYTSLKSEIKGGSR